MAGTALRVALWIAAALVTLGLVAVNVSLALNRLQTGSADSRSERLAIGLYVTSAVLAPMTVVYRSGQQPRERPLLRSILGVVFVLNLIAAPALLVTLAQ